MFGAYLTCRGKLTMSVNRGKADLALGRVEVSVWGKSGPCARVRRGLSLTRSGHGVVHTDLRKSPRTEMHLASETSAFCRGPVEPTKSRGV